MSLLVIREKIQKAIVYSRLHGATALLRLLIARLGGLRSLITGVSKGHWHGDREAILVVSHEASRTGAPILALNLVQELARGYNVVVLLLGGGGLYDEFRRAGATVKMASHLRMMPRLSGFSVGRLCGNFKFRFALVNSVESGIVLPALKRNLVPTISLIHEFASYTRPRSIFREALFWSDKVVFSANITLENAFLEFSDLIGRSAHVLPQGRCLVPMGGEGSEQHQIERTRIRLQMRPDGVSEDTVIVLGAGSVLLRKGVDKFIECAAHVVQSPGGRRCRFIWIGKGYDPDHDIGYSVYLADQVHRAGLQEHVFFLDETTAIEAAYEEADLFLLSSRLDPLPNVAIDALEQGVPVLCFDKTTGVADFLIETGLRDYCVADYLDSADMAKKILALADSETLRSQVADRCRDASNAYFDMKKYVTNLDAIARGVRPEKQDTETLEMQ